MDPPKRSVGNGQRPLHPLGNRHQSFCFEKSGLAPMQKHLPTKRRRGSPQHKGRTTVGFRQSNRDTSGQERLQKERSSTAREQINNGRQHTKKRRIPL